MIDWTIEVYGENINPKVIKEYERYVELGIIRVYNPIDEYKSEEDAAPVWETIKLTEQELLRRISKAKKIASEMKRMKREGIEIDF
jgi:hypothetical protein